MKIETQKFGLLEIDENSIINFPYGLVGFENCHRFVLIKNEDFDPFCWLLSIDNDEVSLPILNPYIVKPDFDSNLPEYFGKDTFTVKGSENIFCVVNIKDMKGKFTINLKSPILVDIVKKEGKQLILDSEELLVDQPVW